MLRFAARQDKNANEFIRNPTIGHVVMFRNGRGQTPTLSSESDPSQSKTGPCILGALMASKVPPVIKRPVFVVDAQLVVSKTNMEASQSRRAVQIFKSSDRGKPLGSQLQSAMATVSNDVGVVCDVGMVHAQELNKFGVKKYRMES